MSAEWSSLGNVVDTIQSEWAKVNLNFLPVFRQNMLLVYRKDFGATLILFVEKLISGHYSVDSLLKEVNKIADKRLLQGTFMRT